MLPSRLARRRAGIARETKDLVARAKGGSLRQDEITTGTFSITNLGAFGILASLSSPDRPHDDIKDFAGLGKDRPALAALLTIFLLVPLWLAVLTGAGWWLWGNAAATLIGLGTLPLAIFTRNFLERRKEALHDLRVFFLLGSQRAFKTRLLDEGDALAREVEEVAKQIGTELGPAASTLAHLMLTDRHTVVPVDWRNIEPLPEDASGTPPLR